MIIIIFNAFALPSLTTNRANASKKVSVCKIFRRRRTWGQRYEKIENGELKIENCGKKVTS